MKIAHYCFSDNNSTILANELWDSVTYSATGNIIDCNGGLAEGAFMMLVAPPTSSKEVIYALYVLRYSNPGLL